MWKPKAEEICTRIRQICIWALLDFGCWQQFLTRPLFFLELGAQVSEGSVCLQRSLPAAALGLLTLEGLA